MQTLFKFAWLGLCGWFAGWEIAAFAIRRPDLTLSAFVWRWEGNGWTAARYFLFAGLIWLTFHFVWRMFRG